MNYRINRPLYFLASKIVWIPVKFKLDLATSENASRTEGPAVVLVNHESNMDWLITAYLLRKKRIRFVVGRYQFRNPLKGKFFSMMGSIPKEQFYPDIQSIKIIMKAIKDKDWVILFPTGQSSYSGECTYIPFETAKLIKRLAIPVYCVHINGAHLAFPKWDMSKIRKHRISATFSDLLSPEEIGVMDELAIYKKIRSELYFDDYEWQRKKMIPSGVRNVEGLDRILYMCPACSAEFQMSAARNVLSCRSCGFSATMDTYGFLSSENPGFSFDTPTKWYRWQYGETARQPERESGYHLHSEVKLEVLGFNGKVIESHDGGLSFTNGLLEFREAGSDKIVFHANVTVNPMLFQHESIDFFELLYQGRIYRFIPAQKGAATKFVILKELSYLVEKRNTAKDPDVQKLYDKLINKVTAD